MEEKEPVEKFKKKVTGLMLFPVVMFTLALIGHFELLALTVLLFLLSLKLQREIVSFIKSDAWYRNVLLYMSSLLSLLMVVRIVFVQQSSPLVYVVVFLFMAALTLGIYLLFASKKGKASIARFSQHSGN